MIGRRANESTRTSAIGIGIKIRLPIVALLLVSAFVWAPPRAAADSGRGVPTEAASDYFGRADGASLASSATALDELPAVCIGDIEEAIYCAGLDLDPDCNQTYRSEIATYSPQYSFVEHAFNFGYTLSPTAQELVYYMTFEYRIFVNGFLVVQSDQESQLASYTIHGSIGNPYRRAWPHNTQNLTLDADDIILVEIEYGGNQYYGAAQLPCRV